MKDVPVTVFYFQGNANLRLTLFNSAAALSSNSVSKDSSDSSSNNSSLFVSNVLVRLHKFSLSGSMTSKISSKDKGDIAARKSVPSGKEGAEGIGSSENAIIDIDQGSQ